MSAFPQNPGYRSDGHTTAAASDTDTGFLPEISFTRKKQSLQKLPQTEVNIIPKRQIQILPLSTESPPTQTNILELFQRGKTLGEVVTNSQKDIQYLLTQLEEVPINEPVKQTSVFSSVINTPTEICVRPTETAIDMLQKLDKTALFMACSIGISISQRDQPTPTSFSFSNDIDSLLIDFDRRRKLSEISVDSSRMSKPIITEEISESIVVDTTDSSEVASSPDYIIGQENVKKIKEFFEDNKTKIHDMNADILWHERVALYEEKDSLVEIHQQYKDILQDEIHITEQYEKTFTTQRSQLISYQTTELEETEQLTSEYQLHRPTQYSINESNISGLYALINDWGDVSFYAPNNINNNNTTTTSDNNEEEEEEDEGMYPDEMSHQYEENTKDTDTKRQKRQKRTIDKMDIDKMETILLSVNESDSFQSKILTQNNFEDFKQLRDDLFRLKQVFDFYKHWCSDDINRLNSLDENGELHFEEKEDNQPNTNEVGEYNANSNTMWAYNSNSLGKDTDHNTSNNYTEGFKKLHDNKIENFDGESVYGGLGNNTHTTDLLLRRQGDPFEPKCAGLEWEHDFMSDNFRRVKSVKDKLKLEFAGEKHIRPGWKTVNQKLLSNIDSDTYGFSNGQKSLYRRLSDVKTLNEDSFVDTVFKHIQENDPIKYNQILYYKVDKLCTEYYSEEEIKKDTPIINKNLLDEIQQIREKLTTLYNGSIIIPIIKSKGPTRCICFYIFRSRPLKHKGIEFNFDDMGIDSRYLMVLTYHSIFLGEPTQTQAELNYERVDANFSTNIGLGNPVDILPLWFLDNNLDMRNIQIMTDYFTENIDKKLATGKPIAKKIDPLTTSKTAFLNSFNLPYFATVNDETNDIFVFHEISLAQQPTEVIEHFRKLANTRNLMKIIVEYVNNNTKKEVETQGKHFHRVNEDVLLLNPEDTIQIFLEFAYRKATIEGMNDLIHLFMKSGIEHGVKQYIDKISYTNIVNNNLHEWSDVTFHTYQYPNTLLTEEKDRQFTYRMATTTVDSIGVQIDILQKMYESLQLENKEVFKMIIKVLVEKHDEEILYIINIIMTHIEAINPIISITILSIIKHTLYNIKNIDPIYYDISIYDLLLICCAYVKSTGDALQRKTTIHFNILLKELFGKEFPKVVLSTNDRVLMAAMMAENETAETRDAIGVMSTLQLIGKAPSIDGPLNGGPSNSASSDNISGGSCKDPNIPCVKVTTSGLLIYPSKLVEYERENLVVSLQQSVNKLIDHNIEIRKRIKIKLNVVDTSKLSFYIQDTVDAMDSSEENNSGVLFDGYIVYTTMQSLITKTINEIQNDDKTELSIMFDDILKQLLDERKILDDILKCLDLFVDTDDTNHIHLVNAAIKLECEQMLSDIKTQMRSVSISIPTSIKTLKTAISEMDGYPSIVKELFGVFTKSTENTLLKLEDYITKLNHYQSLVVVESNSQDVESQNNNSPFKTVIEKYKLLQINIKDTYVNELKNLYNKLEIEYKSMEIKEQKGTSSRAVGKSYVDNSDVMGEINELYVKIEQIQKRIQEQEELKEKHLKVMENLLKIIDTEKQNSKVNSKQNADVTPNINAVFAKTQNTTDINLPEPIIQLINNKEIDTLVKFKNHVTSTYKKIIKELQKNIKLSKDNSEKQESEVIQKKSKIKPAKERPTSLGYYASMSAAKEGLTKISNWMSSSFRRQGGTIQKKPIHKSRKTYTKQNNKRSNRRIRKLGVLTRKRNSIISKRKQNRRKTIHHKSPK